MNQIFLSLHFLVFYKLVDKYITMDNRSNIRGLVHNTELKKVEILISQYLKILNDNLPKLHNQNLQLRSNVYLFNYLERFYFAWNSINMILPELNLRTQHNYSVGILARSVIIDCITTLYLIVELDYKKGTKRDETKFLEACKKLDFDFIKAKIHLLKEGGNSEEDLQRAMEKQHNAIKHTYPDFFIQNRGKFEIAKFKRLTIEEMAKTKIPFVSDKAYFLYKIYSQYEHCSYFTKSMLTEFNRANFGFLLDSFFICSILTNEILLIINQPDTAEKIFKEIMEEVKELRNELFPEPK